MATGRSSADALTLADVRTARSAKWATVKGRVTWNDGDPATDATISCSAPRLQATVAASRGTFKCSWRIPAGLAGKRIGVAVTAADPQIEKPVTQRLTIAQPRVR
jgi:hypothetical protein